MGDEANPKRDRIENIQALRGVAILLVVFAHIMAIEQKYGGGDGILPDFFALGVSGVCDSHAVALPAASCGCTVLL
jgi:peptidoglycan/LPS O-acetylase OafA/YrhL